MTNSKNFLVAAAALVISAGAAMAQELKADIPFAFQVGHKTLAAGTYKVDRPIAGADVYRLSNHDDGAIVLAQSTHDANKEWKEAGTPKMAFRCGEAKCVLVELWDGERPQVSFAVPKSVDMGTRIAVVTLRHEAKGD